MKKSRKAKKKSHPSDNQSDQVTKPVAGDNSRSWSRTIRDLMFGLFICLFFFLAIEGGLRVFWPIENATQEDPFVGFSAIHPLFQEHDGQVTISTNRLRYFNEVSFKAVKPKNTFRIFAFGGSTTYGHPFNWQTSFPRWLQELLNSCGNGVDYEVINLGGISYASYRIIPLMKETLAYRPDLFIVYTGQNEFLERRSYASIMNRNQTLLLVEATLEKMRLYQALKHIMGKVTSDFADNKADKSPTVQDRPDKTVLQDEASAILDRSSGLDLYHRDDQFSQGVEKHFRHNINTLISLSESENVPLIFVTPASNLRDFSPFKSEHEQSLSLREKNSLDRIIREAEVNVKAGAFQRALDELNAILPKIRDHAQANFVMAKALDGLGRHDEARQYFIRARDLDVCPLRATSPLESVIYSVTSARKTPVADFSKFVQDQAYQKGIKSGLGGDESFLDHLHPTVDLHQKLAELLMRKMSELGLLKNCKELSPDRISSVFDSVSRNLDSGLFVTRDLNLAKTLKWAGKKDEAKAALERILGTEANNPEVHKMLGAYALEDAQTQQAIVHYKRALELSGGDPQLKLSLATAYYRSGDKNAAKRIYENMIENGESSPDIVSNLSMLYLEENRVNDALNQLEKFLENHSESSLLFAPYGLALAMSGDLENGIKWTTKASEAEPGDPSHLYNLAGMYALTGNASGCFRSLNLAIDRGYSNADKLRRDPLFTEVRNSSEFYRILDRISD